MTATGPVTPGPHRFSIRLPRPLWIRLATVVLVVTFIPVRVWLLNLWQKRTIDQFLQYAREGDSAKCRAMLTEDRSAVWTLDDHCLRIAAERPLITEPPSFLNYMVGRQRYRVHLAYSNDHSFTVAGGRVTMGSAFWIQYFPPGPEFRLTKQVKALEEDRLRQQGETDPETEQ